MLFLPKVLIETSPVVFNLGGLKVDTPDSIKTFCTEGFKIVRDHNEFTLNDRQKMWSFYGK